MAIEYTKVENIISINHCKGSAKLHFKGEHEIQVVKNDVENWEIVSPSLAAMLNDCTANETDDHVGFCIVY